MKIERNPSLSPLRPTRRARSASHGSQFSAEIDDYIDAPQAEKGQLTSPVPYILTAQEVLATESADAISTPTAEQQARARAESLLDQLKTLRDDLLAGIIPAERLHSLRALAAQQRPHISDPRLIALLDAIDERAAVEIAKWERAVSDPS